MSARFIALSLALFACEPVKADLATPDGDGAGLDAGSGTGGDDGAGGDGSGGDTGGGTGEPEPATTLESGDWVPTDVDVDDDPCDWNDVLEDFFGISVLEFLPTSFEVDGEEGKFEIEAQDYGARGPIECEIEGDAFTCETQSVAPVLFEMGEAGWVYRIDYSGTVVDEETLRGRAVVSYPSVDRGTEQTFDYYGVDPADCTQVYTLELSHDR